MGGAGWVPGSKPRGRFGCRGTGLRLSPPLPPGCLWESYWGMKKQESAILSWPPALRRCEARAWLLPSVVMARALWPRWVGVNGTLRLGGLRVCQTIPAWGKGELLTPPTPIPPPRRVSCLFHASRPSGAALLKNPLAPEAGGRNSSGWGEMWGWALHRGPVACGSNLGGAGAAKETVILIGVTSGTSNAQILVPVFAADGRSHPRGCLIGTLKIKSQVLIAALGSGACNSGMLGSDFPPPACCIGDTNICGASWVCAVKAALLLYASEWSRAKPGQKKKKKKTKEEFQPGLFSKGGRT